MKNGPLRLIEAIPLNPMIRIGEVLGFPDAQAYAIPEFKNPGGSHKDRPVRQMINQALKSGDLRQGMTVIEFSTGSMGASTATLLRDELSVIICMPEGISAEREKLIRDQRATLLLTPSDRHLTEEERMRGLTRRDIWIGGCRQVAEALRDEDPEKFFLMNQSDNPNNLKAFYELGYQILRQCPKPIDYFVCGVGTGATWAGVTEVLKKHSPHTKSISIDPFRSPSTHHSFYKIHFDPNLDHHPHQIFGYGAGGVSPIAQHGLSLVNQQVGDRAELVSQDEVFAMCRHLKQKGLWVGPTSAANALVVQKILQKEPEACIATIFFDSGERYISTGLFD